MFKAVTLEFKDQKYHVAPERVWGLIAAMEAHCSYMRVCMMMAEKNLQRVPLVEALTAGLKYAGANVEAEAVSAEYGVFDLFAIANTLISIYQIAEPPAEANLPDVAEEKKEAKTKGKQQTSTKQKPRL